MIFGYLGCPPMGIRGAALATVISQAVATVWLPHLLWKKHLLIVFVKWRFNEYLASFRKIFGLGVPSILSMILMPISATVIARILNGFGKEAIAASGAAGRIEVFAFVVPLALGISLAPFVSQNFGAGQFDRVRKALKVSTRFALLYGRAASMLFFIYAPLFASAFSSDPKVVPVLVAYIRIICFGYGMMEVHRYCGIILTRLHKPISSALLNSIRILVPLIPGLAAR